MKYMIDITAQAKSDLQSIYEYIAFELIAPENAAGQLDRLEKSIMKPGYMPLRFKEYEHEPWKSRGLRVMPMDNFVVLYIPNEETGVITIIRIIYGGRNIEEQLRQHTKFR